MMNINITFPDNSVKEYPLNISPLEIAESISHGLAANVISARVNEKLVDLNYQIKEDSNFELFKFDNEIGKEVFWR